VANEQRRTLSGVIDPLISIAFGVHSNRGAYALLVGSGISRSAGIPTGWEVVTDLIERVAQLEGAGTSGDPAAWYRERYGTDPEYSKLLAQLAGQPAERNRLLRSYFEPNAEEREEGLKVPTPAHRAIARLVRNGFIRVIVTTNFDRLLERALDEVGVVPTVIASADAASGALPLAHTDCTIVKVHGDYLDARIRNTADELANYDPRVDALLDRVFDEYGLIVCGWSGEWDDALRHAIERCPTRRFTTYWATRGDLGERATRLLTARAGVIVTIESSDAFFQELEEKVSATAELRSPHPESGKVAVAALKRYLADDRHRIRLRDLVMGDVRRVEEETGVEQFPANAPIDQDAFVARLERYEAVCEPLVTMLATAGYWATPEQYALVIGAIDELGRRFEPGRVGGTVAWVALLNYPATLALYGAGLGAVLAGKLDLLAQLLGLEITEYGERRRLLERIAPTNVVEGQLLQPADRPRYLTPVNDRLHEVLRHPLRELIPSDDRYTEIFDRFEYILTLAFADGRDAGWAPVGSYGWRSRRREHGTPYAWIAAEGEAAGEGWALLQGPLFGQSRERFDAVRVAVDEMIGQLHWL